MHKNDSVLLLTTALTLLSRKYLLFSPTKKMLCVEKIKKKLEKYPAYVKFLKFRDKVAGCILTALLACLTTVGPVWNFLFVKEPKPYELNEASNNIIPNPFKPSSNGPTDTQS